LSAQTDPVITPHSPCYLTATLLPADNTDGRSRALDFWPRQGIGWEGHLPVDASLHRL